MYSRYLPKPYTFLSREDFVDLAFELSARYGVHVACSAVSMGDRLVEDDQEMSGRPEEQKFSYSMELCHVLVSLATKHNEDGIYPTDMVIYYTDNPFIPKLEAIVCKRLDWNIHSLEFFDMYRLSDYTMRTDDESVTWTLWRTLCLKKLYKCSLPCLILACKMLHTRSKLLCVRETKFINFTCSIVYCCQMFDVDYSTFLQRCIEIMKSLR